MHAFYESRNTFFESFAIYNMNFPAHHHRQVELLYVLEGEIEVMSDGKYRNLSQGELFISFPNTIHSYRTPHASRIFLIIFEHTLVSDYSNLLLQMEATNPFLMKESLHAEASYIINKLFVNRHNEQNMRLIKGYLLVMLSRTIEELQLVNRENQMSSDVLHCVLLYISQHFREPISQESTAQACGINKYQLSRIFTSNVGSSFNKYVNALRVEYAKHLLQTTNLSATEIGYASGFTSQCSYYRAFRENVLPSPKKFRQESANYKKD